MKNRAAGLLILLLISPLFALATHLRAGEITVERTNCTSLTFKITITVYTNTGSEIRFGEGLLDFGDGSTHTTPTIENTKREDLGPDVGTVSYSVLHTYSGPGRYVISYLEPNRNGGIVNIFNSVETRFYIETVINIDPFLGCNNSPKLLVPPIDKACTGAAWFHNPGAYDPDGDSISFEMTIPKKEKGQVVGNYRQPDNQEFYLDMDYGLSNEAGNGPPTFKIDQVTGTLVWDAPGAVSGEYNIAFIIKEWRKINDLWVQMGYVTRDMQIIVEDCDNERPELIVPEDICVEAGEEISQDIFGFDPDGDNVLIEAYSQVFSIDPSRAEITVPNPNDYQPSSPTSHAFIRFHWQTDCSHVKEQPYQVVFKITDKPAGGQRLIQFKTWNITVVGPAPTWQDAETVQTTRTANLSWDTYACPNATTMQIWRRVDQFPFTPPECVTGMPAFLGYSQIAEVPISQTSFVDNNNGRGLAIGAQYCYRLVAVYPSPGGGESYVSEDICIDPILITAPVVTNVTVDQTANEAGQITVRWMPPVDLDPAQFPPPYSYQVFRAEGISGDLKLKVLHPGTIDDTFFVDANDEGLNTEGIIYNYRVIAFDANNVQVPDSSDVASSVRLEAKPQLQRIELVWTADVPWSLRTADFPMHDIYRGGENTLEDDLELIATVDVNQGGFVFVDDGSFNGVPLDESTVYCYKVLTRGSYGSDKIVEPLLNYSQKTCAQPNDDVPPCTPDLSITPVSCEERLKTMSCGFSLGSNTITWNRPTDPDCANDVVSYNIYYTTRIGQDFNVLVENVRDTFYIDANLGSNARCYKIQAVDRSGNKSEMSEQFCFDNCPYYELPNVFTPGGLDQCNQYFSAFSDRVEVDEDGEGPCGVVVNLEELRTRCARYVLAVQFKVYNRWGLEVYNYTGDVFGQGGERSIFIDWDGRDSQGVDLSEGVYYYVAEVTYDVVDPAQSVETMKGWVHLVR